MKYLWLFVSKTNFRKIYALGRFLILPLPGGNYFLEQENEHLFPSKLRMREIRKGLEFGKENKVSAIDISVLPSIW